MQITMSRLVYIESKEMDKGYKESARKVYTHVFYSEDETRVIKVEDEDRKFTDLETWDPATPATAVADLSHGAFNGKPWENYKAIDIKRLPMA
jgi:hypothetical protein